MEITPAGIRALVAADRRAASEAVRQYAADLNRAAEAGLLTPELLENLAACYRELGELLAVRDTLLRMGREFGESDVLSLRVIETYALYEDFDLAEQKLIELLPRLDRSLPTLTALVNAYRAIDHQPWPKKWNTQLCEAEDALIKADFENFSIRMDSAAHAAGHGSTARARQLLRDARKLLGTPKLDDLWKWHQLYGLQNWCDHERQKGDLVLSAEIALICYRLAPNDPNSLQFLVNSLGEIKKLAPGKEWGEALLHIARFEYPHAAFWEKIAYGLERGGEAPTAKIAAERCLAIDPTNKAAATLRAGLELLPPASQPARGKAGRAPSLKSRFVGLFR